jgi:cellulose synthase (UDP-forming)
MTVRVLAPMRMAWAKLLQLPLFEALREKLDRPVSFALWRSWIKQWVIQLGPAVSGQAREQLEVTGGERWWKVALRLVWMKTPDQHTWRKDLFRTLEFALYSILWVGRGILSLIYWMFAPLRWSMRGLDLFAFRFRRLPIGQWVQTSVMPLIAPVWVRAVLFAICVSVGLMVVTTPFSWRGQLLFLVLCWCSAMVIRRMPGRYPGLAMSTIALLAMGRYAWWRIENTLIFNSSIEYALGLGLLLAEAYTWLVVVLGFIQCSWSLQRKSAELPADKSTWPSVDVYIPTYNEPMSVVRPTVLAAMSMDWPQDRLRVYILDDGRRPEFRDFAQAMDVGYITRPDGRHAKAGNLNNAMTKTDGELIAIFDCDHMPVRSFLESTVGWFVKDERIAMVQTPHHFFSPDPFERNLKTFKRVPNEGALFYGLIQDCNDLWNATFFCGSCAVIRRKPLEEVGGIAVETVTEDAHTALKLQRLGYHTAYINKTLAAGLATESLSAHVGQRIRWARGMAQIFRVDNPFLGKGLNFFQRICYANAMMHFFFGLPRLVFMTAPLCYLFFEFNIIGANAALLALYVMPYILQSNLANAHVQGEHRHTFWAEVYETVLAWYVALPTTVAMINPKLGKFNVTAKGGLVEEGYFDWAISKPYIVLAVLNFAGFVFGLFRLFWFNSYEAGTVLVNLFWAVYNMVILGASFGIAAESRQLRTMHRVATSVPAVLYTPDGCTWHATCMDFSLNGIGLTIQGIGQIPSDTRLQVGLWSQRHEHVFPVRVVNQFDDKLGLKLESLTKRQEINLVQCTFAHSGVWNSWSDTQNEDRPLKGLQEITALGIHGYRIALSYAWDWILSSRGLLRGRAANGRVKT